MNTSEIDLDSPAINALDSLFKHTEVYLRDDGFPSDNRQVPSCPKHTRFKHDDDDDYDVVKDDFGVANTLNTSVGTSEKIVLMEDGDLFREMSVLGLPLSFQTSKQHSSVQTKGKNEAKKKKGDNSQTRFKDQMQVSQKVNIDRWCHANLQDKSVNTSPLSLLDQADHFCSGSDVSDETVSPSNTCDIKKPVDVTVETRCGGLETHIDEPVPNHMSSESLIDDLLVNDSQMETKMISTAATSGFLEAHISCSCMHDNCSDENLKEMDRNLMEEIKTKGLELGSCAMELEDLDLGVCNRQTQVGMSEDAQMIVDNDSTDINFSATCVEWSAFWDSFYMRYYFYNTKTQESTWYPPPGMESLAFGDMSNVSDSDELNAEIIETNVNHANSHNEQHLDIHDELVQKACFDDQTEDICGAKEHSTNSLSFGSAMMLDIPCVRDGNCQDLTANESFNGSVITLLSDSSSLSNTLKAMACDDDHHNLVHMDELEMVTNGFCFQKTPAATKQKKKRKNRRRKKSFNQHDNHEFEPIEEHCVNITKYWCQRYLLFSKFDDGIQMDEEGWFSVTPEAIARHHASRLGGGIVIDCFAGVGGNIIQFAKTSKHVIAIDIDPKKIGYAHNNATIYGVEDKIDFINGDCFSLAPQLKADTIFLSPPWGGPDYIKLPSYDIDMLQPYDGKFLFNTFKVTASLLIMFLPRNVDVGQLAELSLSSDTPWSLEVEKNFVNGKLKAVTAYFSRTS